MSEEDSRGSKEGGSRGSEDLCWVGRRWKEEEPLHAAVVLIRGDL